MSSFFSNVASLKAQNYLILKNLNFLLERDVNCFQSEHKGIKCVTFCFFSIQFVIFNLKLKI